MSIQFKIGGVSHTLRSDEVVARMRGATPGHIRSHAVEIDGTLFPMKEAFAKVTGLDLLDFTTNQARSVFKRLGFKVVRT